MDNRDLVIFNRMKEINWFRDEIEAVSNYTFKPNEQKMVLGILLIKSYSCSKIFQEHRCLSTLLVAVTPL